jgi:hypothetical protein
MTLKRIFLSSFALLAFAPLAFADGADPACAVEMTAYKNAPTVTSKADAWDKYNTCSETYGVKHKQQLIDTANDWAASLDRMPQGGWVLLGIGSDGTVATFGSLRHATRQGNIVTVWLRFEYRETQGRPGNYHKSQVQRVMNDCVGMRIQAVSSSGFSDNNLSGQGQTFTTEETKGGWISAIPGSLGEMYLDWACKTAPRSAAQTAKAQ